MMHMILEEKNQEKKIKNVDRASDIDSHFNRLAQ